MVLEKAIKKRNATIFEATSLLRRDGHYELCGRIQTATKLLRNSQNASPAQEPTPAGLLSILSIPAQKRSGGITLELSAPTPSISLHKHLGCVLPMLGGSIHFSSCYPPRPVISHLYAAGLGCTAAPNDHGCFFDSFDLSVGASFSMATRVFFLLAYSGRVVFKLKEIQDGRCL